MDTWTTNGQNTYVHGSQMWSPYLLVLPVQSIGNSYSLLQPRCQDRMIWLQLYVRFYTGALQCALPAFSKEKLQTRFQFERAYFDL